MAANAGRHNNKALVSVMFTACRFVAGSGTERVRVKKERKEEKKIYNRFNLYKKWSKQGTKVTKTINNLLNVRGKMCRRGQKHQ